MFEGSEPRSEGRSGDVVLDEAVDVDGGGGVAELNAGDEDEYEGDNGVDRVYDVSSPRDFLRAAAAIIGIFASREAEPSGSRTMESILRRDQAVAAGVPHITTGDLVRDEINSSGPLSKQRTRRIELITNEITSGNTRNSRNLAATTDLMRRSPPSSRPPPPDPSSGWTPSSSIPKAPPPSMLTPAAGNQHVRTT
ncbi:uncharacterized protein A4U43_C08F29140 [Asparagus officinalis]|nr:uncharacterized protein A4U43_C08F29140 [Asparagus officinalis]